MHGLKIPVNKVKTLKREESSSSRKKGIYREAVMLFSVYRQTFCFYNITCIVILEKRNDDNLETYSFLLVF